MKGIAHVKGIKVCGHLLSCVCLSVLWCVCVNCGVVFYYRVCEVWCVNEGHVVCECDDMISIFTRYFLSTGERPKFFTYRCVMMCDV